MQGWGDDFLPPLDPDSDIGIPMPAWNYDMEQTFGQTAPLLRTTEDVNSAMYTLYWWRVEYDLENPVMFRRRQLDWI